MSANTSTDDSTASKPTEREYDRDEQGRRSCDRYAQMIQVCYNDALVKDSIEANTDTGEFEAYYDPSRIEGELEFSTLPSDEVEQFLNGVEPEDVVEVEVLWQKFETDGDSIRVKFNFDFEYYNYDRPRLNGGDDACDVA